MRRSRFLATLVKEARLLSRDLHGLALLFILPTAFILIMSLAMQDMFESRAGARVAFGVVDLDQTPASADFVRRLGEGSVFSLSTADSETRDTLIARARAGEISLAVVVGKGYGAALERAVSPQALRAAAGGQPAPDAPPPADIEMIVAPDADKRLEMIFAASLREAMGRQRVDELLKRIAPRPASAAAPPPDAPSPADAASDDAMAKMTVSYTYDAADQDARPSAVQQNVPAWLVFSIFFVSIPFSNTFIRERELGTQRRLRTTNLPPVVQVLGKLLPYFVVNQLQVGLMLAMGVFVVPLLGGQALQLNGDPAALALMGVAVSFAALGCALLIAELARTTEQATMLSGLGNIVLAAIGGIMVPRFVMPDALQQMSQVSPMAWGLDGFLEVLLHGGDVQSIVPMLAKLGGLGVIAFLVATVLHRRQE